MVDSASDRLSSVTVRPMRSDDLSAMAVFRQTFVEEQTARRAVSADYFRWKLLQNPAGPGIGVLAWEGNNVVGMATMTPKTLYVGGECVRADELGDCFVAPSYQGKFLFPKLLREGIRLSYEAGSRMLYGTPNELALPMERRVGYQIVNTLKIAHLVFPLRLRNLGPALSPIRLPGLVWRMNEAVVRAYFASRLFINGVRYKGVTIAETSEYRAELESLYEQICPAYDVMMARTQKYLAWRFQQNPDRYRLVTAHEHGQLIGYAVGKRGTWKGLSVLYVADMLVQEGQANLLPALLGGLKGRIEAEEGSIDLMSLWIVQHSHGYSVLRRLGFLPRKMLSLIVHKEHLGGKIQDQAPHWYFTMADSDNI